MRVSYNWLKEYVNFQLSPYELAHKLTMVGLAVDTVEYLGEGIEGVVVGQVMSISDHPNADKLVVCQVDVGKGEYLQVVTGAPNVRQGQKVPVALPGSILPSGVKIKKAKFRGVESAGMLCSAQELNIPEETISDEDRDGILELEPDAPIGADAAEVLGLDDYVLVFDLTPNRADCLSVINIAREVAAVTGGQVQLPEVQLPDGQGETGERASVTIDAPDLCGRYVARIVEGITIKPSPRWLQQRLQAAGVRPINNIVDVTNYVMLEMGQPLHAFDYTLLKNHRIIVRRADRGEKLVTLDGVERRLQPDMLVIADPEKAVGLAGVMGGENTEVSEGTTTVLIESAHFEPANIRRTARELGLRSEASTRFEKGVNIEGALMAASRAAQLMAALSGGIVISGAIDNYPQKQAPKVVTLRVSRVHQVLGVEIGNEQVTKLLQLLGFGVKHRGDDVITVDVPPYRLDISREIDLIEEVARLYGYDRIPTTLPTGRPSKNPPNRFQRLQDEVRIVLSCSGLSEVITYSFISPKDYDKIMLPINHPWRNVVAIQNPLSEDQSVMRTTLVPGLLDVAARNTKRHVENLAIYELGRVFKPTKNQLLPEERTLVGALVMGEWELGWKWSRQEMDFYFLKGILEELLGRMGITNVNFKPVKDYSFLHPGRSASINVGEVDAGFIGQVHPDVLEQYQLKKKAILCQLDLELLLEVSSPTVTYRPLSRYPAVVRDMAIIVEESVPAAQVNAVIADAGGDLLREFSLFDVYHGQQIPEGHKSLAYSMVYQSWERTLTDVEVNEVHQRIQNALARKLGAQLR